MILTNLCLEIRDYYGFQSLYAHNTNERFTQSLYEATDYLSDSDCYSCNKSSSR